MTNAVGWRAWYWLFTAMSGLALVLTIFFVPESAYDRPIAAFMGTAPQEFGPTGDSDAPPAADNIHEPITTLDEHKINTVNYAPRTLRSDMRVFVTPHDWSKAFITIKHITQLLVLPHILWLALMNGFFLAIDISISITYGPILVAPPYNWAKTSVSIAQVGQLPVAFIAMPLLGWLSDFIVTKMAKRNGGRHEPEYRLLTLVFPLLLLLILTAIYGAAAENPYGYHWMAIIFPQNVWLFLLFAANTVGITYLLDSHPKRAGPVLVIMCLMRGLVSFGVSYHTVDYVDAVGYVRLFGIYAGLMALFGVLGIGVFVWGKRIRHWVVRWTN